MTSATTAVNTTTKKAILLLGGSFNPVHTEHLQLLVQIRKCLENEYSYEIIAGYLVVTTDKYIFNKLRNNGMKFHHRHQMCILSTAKTKNHLEDDLSWIHPSHIPYMSAPNYGEMITRKSRYLQFFNEENGNAITVNELEKLVRVICMGADKISENPGLMRWMMSYSHPLKIYCCIGNKYLYSCYLFLLLLFFCLK